MRPIVTIITLLVLIAIIVLFTIPRDQSHPQENAFVESVVDLLILSARGDTVSASFLGSRDSILEAHGLSDSSLLAIKQELNKKPERLIEVWSKIEERLKILQDSLGFPSDTTGL